MERRNRHTIVSRIASILDSKISIYIYGLFPEPTCPSWTPCLSFRPYSYTKTALEAPCGFLCVAFEFYPFFYF